MRKGQEQLRVLMGGKACPARRRQRRRRRRRRRRHRARRHRAGACSAVVAAWVFASLYRVDTSEQSVELLFGERYAVGTEGLNFAPWPVVTYEVYPVTRENTIDIGAGHQRRA